MSTDTLTPEDDLPDQGLTDDQREMLEWISENSERLGPVAERILQDEEESPSPAGRNS